MTEHFLIQLVRAKMPFGKYKGRYITDLPTYYLEWMYREGFKSDKLGHYLSTMYEIQTNGLMHVIKPIIKQHR